jgi:glucose/arabinose dehydrogenase
MKQLLSLHPPILTSIIVLLLVLNTPQTCRAQTPILSFDSLVGGLSQPVDIVNAGDGSNRLFIVEKEGRIKIFSGGIIQPVPFLDLTGSNLISTPGERGLLSMAFHPAYETNGYFFIFYTKKHADPALEGDLEISRFQVTSNPNVADVSSRKTVITIPHHTYTNHNGGKLNFGHDTSLYLSTGDGGSGNDPENNGQNRSTLLGKMIRILVNDSTDTAPFYTAPADNPYAADAPEVFAIGLRNPFRWSFDRNGAGPWDMWIGDVGQNAWEEINFRAAGLQKTNFGWRCYEGTQNTPGLTPCSPVPPDTVNPVHHYATGVQGRSVTGGIVYRGSAFPTLQGWYTAVDFFSGNAWLIKSDRSQPAIMQSGFPDGIAGFGESEAREVYAVSMFDGSIYQLQSLGIVPIKLVDFKVEQKTSQHLITWKTAMEENMLRFEVQFSNNGSIFSTVHSETASNKPNGHEYAFSYPISHFPDIYYRLLMIDKDGRTEYSNTVHLKGRAAKVLITPNIINGNQLHIQTQAIFNRLEIFDMNGRLRYTSNQRLMPGRNTIQLSGLAKGMYIVRLTNGNEQVNELLIY